VLHDVTEQAFPLSVNDAGRGLVPVCVPLNPNVTDAPGASTPFQAAFVAVTCVPDWVAFADQTCVTRWPLANGKTSDQPSMVDGRVLVTVTEAVNPLLQSFVV
jgi:hypothetical protein